MLGNQEIYRVRRPMNHSLSPLRAPAGVLLLWLSLLAGAVMAEQPADFALPDMNGETHRLSDYRGKWVLVNYWATWCPPCLEELPELEVFHAHNAADRAVVLGVNMEDIDLTELRAFIEQQFVSYPILIAGPRPKALLGQVPGLPTSFLVNREGQVVARQVGPVTADAINRFIAEYEAKHGAGGV
jgi:thiol-disulfide isomerase/thioredoxin